MAKDIVLTEESVIELGKNIPKSKYREYFENALNIEKIYDWYAFIATQQGKTIKEALANYKIPPQKVAKSTNTKETIAQEQRRIKPNLEDIIASRASMDNDAKQVAFELLDYCNEKNVTYKWSSTNRWNLYSKGKSFGYIGIGSRENDDDSWYILLNHRVFLQHKDIAQKEDLLKFIYNNLHYCEGCDGNRCASCTSKLGFKNPDIETLESVKKIFDFGLT